MSRRLLPVFVQGIREGSKPQLLPFQAMSASKDLLELLEVAHPDHRPAETVATLCGFDVLRGEVDTPTCRMTARYHVSAYEAPTHENAVAWIVFVDGATPRPLPPEFAALIPQAPKDGTT